MVSVDDIVDVMEEYVECVDVNNFIVEYRGNDKDLGVEHVFYRVVFRAGGEWFESHEKFKKEVSEEDIELLYKIVSSAKLCSEEFKELVRVLRGFVDVALGVERMVYDNVPGIEDVSFSVRSKLCSLDVDVDSENFFDVECDIGMGYSLMMHVSPVVSVSVSSGLISVYIGEDFLAVTFWSADVDVVKFYREAREALVTSKDVVLKDLYRMRGKLQTVYALYRLFP